MPEVLDPPAAAAVVDDWCEREQGEARIVVRLPASVSMNDEQFLEFCEINSELRMEREANGDIVIMTSEGLEGSPAHWSLAMQIGTWAEQDDTGEFIGPAGGFKLPNTAIRAADVSWILKSRLRKLAKEDRVGHVPICPDFVVELRSRTDSLVKLKRKMEEYLANGARLGWLLDPFSRKDYVYRPNAPVEELNDPTTLSGEDVLPGFALNVRPVWRKLGEKENDEQYGLSSRPLADLGADRRSRF